ncbi:MAG: hypothetical protein M0C28_46845 [Candidatus Moduliflexus flocculans]|nr:hypothetical protein [Candidatus Moduliflexus flocculans]
MVNSTPGGGHISHHRRGSLGKFTHNIIDFPADAGRLPHRRREGGLPDREDPAEADRGRQEPVPLSRARGRAGRGLPPHARP